MEKGIDRQDNGWSLSALEKPPCPLLSQMNKSCFSLIMEDLPESQGPPAEKNVALIPLDKQTKNTISYALNQHYLCGEMSPQLTVKHLVTFCMTFGQACEILTEYTVADEDEIEDK